MDKIELSKEVKTVMAYVPSIIISSRLSLLRYESLVKAYDELDNEFQKYWRKTVSNNYLKMHGYPMRRRKGA